MNVQTVRSPFSRAVAIACMAALAWCLWLPTVAEAQGRSVAVGIGVLGGVQLLNKLSKSGMASKRRSGSKSSPSNKSKKTYAAKKKSSGSSARAKNDDAPAEAASERKIENAAAEKSNAVSIPPGSPMQSPSAAAVTAGSAATGAAAAGEAMAISSQSEIKAAQQHLQYMGYDVRDVSGKLDLKTKIAIMQFQDSIGEPSTGVLTTKQLQTLFVKVSERTAASK